MPNTKEKEVCINCGLAILIENTFAVGKSRLPYCKKCVVYPMRARLSAEEINEVSVALVFGKEMC